MPNEIHATVRIGSGTTVGHYSVLAENAQIGENCRIGHHVIVHADTVIGNNCVIDDAAVVGKPPLRSAALVRRTAGAHREPPSAGLIGDAGGCSADGFHHAF